MVPLSALFLALACFAGSLPLPRPANAFLLPLPLTRAVARRRSVDGAPSAKRARPVDDDGGAEGDEGSDNSAAAGAMGGDLVAALSRLDDEWALARPEGGGKKIGDWTVLDLRDDDGGSAPEIVYLLEPASGAAPSCVVFFLGGAVLGQFPHVSYSEFLKRLAAKMNASVVAVPYEVGLDHYGIAQRVVERMKGALIACEDGRGYSPSLPKYAVGHSLGAKLHAIGIAATGIGDELSGAGFVSYNNFGFADTVSMARSFAKEMGVGGSFAGSTAPLDALFDLAGMAASAVGLEFTPTPSEMDRILESKFDGELLEKTRLFQFEDDDLDSTKRFVECFAGGAAAPLVSCLPGTHLTVSDFISTF
ncbi:hypothetical protein ACHAWF_015356 [Thalassiosira exigua]